MSRMLFNRLVGARAITLVLTLGVLSLGAQAFGSASAFAGAYLTLNSFSGNPGTRLQVTGGGWTPGDTVNLYVGSVGGTPVSTATVGADSNFSANVVLPAKEPQGSLSIIGVDATNSYQTQNSYYVVPFTPSVKTAAASHSPFGVVMVTGTGYAPNEAITLALAGATASTTADSTGAFTGTITVPMVSSALYNLTATGVASGASSFDYFWIDTFYPSATPSVYYLMPGATLSFNGSGFAPGETINVFEMGSSTPVSTITADGTGSFTAAGGFAIPGADHGKSDVFTLTGTKSGLSTGATVTIGDFFAYASPSSYYLLPGQSDTFSGGGFMAGETVDVYVGASTTPATSFTIDQTGGFMNAGSVQIPFGSASTISFTLKGRTSGATGTASTGVGRYWSSISPSDYYVTPNTDITISGSGFAPSETVTLTVNGATASSTQVTTTAMGGFSAPVHIPFGAGSSTVSAVGNMSQDVTSVSVALATFYPSVTPSGWYLFPGSDLSFTGTGFVPGETVIYTVGGVSNTTTANSFGTITTATTTVPYTAKKSLIATFVGQLSAAQSSVTIALGTPSPYLTSDTYSGTSGGTAGVMGYSFAPHEVVTVTAGSFSTTTVADASGTTPTVRVPLPYMVASLPVTFTGNSTGTTASMSVSLASFYANLSASTYYAKPGTSVTLSGTGFAPNENVAFTGTGISTTTVKSDSFGAASTNVVLPFTGGSSVSLSATGQTSGAISSLSIAFAPYMPQVAPSTYYTLPGSTVTFTGTGFAPNEKIAVGFNGAAVETITVDSTGAFSYPFTIPFGSSKATVSFVGATSGAGIADTISLATYSAYLSLSSYYGNGGSPVTVTGSGFAPNESVALSFNGVAFTTTTADKTGAISVATAVPFSTSGTMPLSAVGSKSGVSAGSSFTVATVYPSFTLGSYASAPGTSVQLMGSNFFPNESVTVTTDRTGSTPVATFATNAAGTFSGSYLLPLNATEGTLVFTVNGNHSLTPQSITFYVTGK